MGMGDELMATGEAHALYSRTAQATAIIGCDGRPRWSPIFERNPKILRTPIHGRALLMNGPNARPYIANKTRERWAWRPYRPIPGELYFSFEEIMFGRAKPDRVVIEPNVKANTHANKAWPWERWQAVASAFPDLFVQCGPAGTRWLSGVDRIETTEFRLACAVLAEGRGYVGTEGGLHHAAAAVRVPAVVLWSEFISPEHTGYDGHVNLRHADGACGSRFPCKGCIESMARISVEEVIENVKRTMLQ